MGTSGHLSTFNLVGKNFILCKKRYKKKVLNLLLFGELRPKILLQELEQAQLMWSSAVEQNAEMLSQVQQLITSVNGEKIDLKWDWHRIIAVSEYY